MHHLRIFGRRRSSSRVDDHFTGTSVTMYVGIYAGPKSDSQIELNSLQRVGQVLILSVTDQVYH